MTERTDVWVLEREVFADRHDGLAQAVAESGAEVISWQDDWWDTGRWPEFDRRSVVFHGSLGSADRIRAELPWRPGAFCNTGQFRCSAWAR